MVRAFEGGAHESPLVDQRSAHRRDDRPDLWIDEDELFVGEQRERFARRRAADAECGRDRRFGQARARREASAHDGAPQRGLDLHGVGDVAVESKSLQRGCKRFLLTGTEAAAERSRLAGGGRSVPAVGLLLVGRDLRFMLLPW